MKTKVTSENKSDMWKKGWMKTKVTSEKKMDENKCYLHENKKKNGTREKKIYT